MTQESLFGFLLPALCVVVGVTGGGYFIFKFLMGNSDWRYDSPPDEQDES